MAERRAPVPTEILDRLAARAPDTARPTAAHGQRGGEDFDVREWLVAHGVGIKREKPWINGATVCELDACVFDDAHVRGEACVIRLATGMLLYKCHHASCNGRTWADVRARLEPDRPPRATGDARWREPAPPGARRPAGNGSSVAVESPSETPEGPRPAPLFVRACHLSAPRVTWLVEGLVADAMLQVLSGKDKRGKTLLALEVACSVLKGIPFLGQFLTGHGPVMAALLDDPLGLTLERLDTLGVRGAADDFYMVDPTRILDPHAVLDHLAQEAPAVQPALVILDALYLFLPEGRESGNDAARMRPLMVRLNRLVEETGAAVLVVAHDNKGGTDVAGSYVVRAMAKAVLRLAVPKESTDEEFDEPTTSRRVLTLESKLAAATAHILELGGVGRWTLLGNPKTVRADDLGSSIERLLAQGLVETAETIAKHLSRRRDRVEEALVSLVQAGRVATGERYPPTGRPATVYANGLTFSPGFMIDNRRRDGKSAAQVTDGQGNCSQDELFAQIPQARGNQKEQKLPERPSDVTTGAREVRRL